MRIHKVRMIVIMIISICFITAGCEKQNINSNVNIPVYKERNDLEYEKLTVAIPSFYEPENDNSQR